MTDLFYVDCICGDRGERELTDPLPGLTCGFICKGCGSVLLGSIGGKKKRSRKSTEALTFAILEIFTEMKPQMTVRQIYYALTVRDVVPKTQAGYRRTCYTLAKMRREGALPYGWIADNTRWRLKPETHTGLDSALERMQAYYRRDLWARQDCYVEIWIEKDALAGVVSPITREYDVPLYVTRGYGSMTFIHDAAEEIKNLGKTTYIYHFGDFDPSGVDAANKIRDGLLEHGATVYFERVAITPQQIMELNLPARETKKSDPRAKSWGDMPSVELDAMPAPVLRELVRGCIEKQMDPDILAWERRIEESEKSTLEEIRGNLVLVQNY